MQDEFVTFSGANLGGANLSGANLARANLNSVNLQGANVSFADFEGADLTHVKFDESTMFTGINVDGAKLSPDLRAHFVRLGIVRGEKRF
jgi:uncharacterized protein YjbI with pentapeptide repeats